MARTASPSAPRPPRRRRIRKLRLLALLAVVGVLGCASFTLGLVAAIASEVPPLAETRAAPQQVNGIVYAADGKTVLAVLRGEENRVLVGADDISQWMKHAIVAIEDRRFYDHRGVDLRGIARALWQDIRKQRVVEGGSTITQQLVKNLYVKNERSLGRKVREAAYAWQLERELGSKERILTEYLNTIYFANGAYGVQQAARIYFGKGAAKLELAEAALLAGIPQDPSRYDPVAQPAAAKARRRAVLRAMLDEGYITAADFRAANRAPLPLADDVRLPGTQSPWAPYFTNYAIEQLVDRLGARRVFGGGLRVTTTIDLGLQRLAQEAIAETLTDPEGPTAALVTVDPTSGEVLAMVGGRNYRKSQFNLAVQGQRQPGSAFKPFVLATALQQGVAPSTVMDSRPTTINLGDKTWTVANYEDVYLGPIDLAQATIHSDNAVYARLTQLVGPAAVVKTAKRLGVRSPLRSFFSIGLGAQAVNPLELARAYSVFANGGYRIDLAARNADLANRPRVFGAITDGRGKVVDPVHPTSRQVLSPLTVGYVNQLLQGVVSGGTGTKAALEGWPAAGKTGTTENYGDAWFAGYTPQLVTVVWVGYPKELKPMETEYDGEPVSGGSFPAEIWKRFMERALPYLEKEPVGFVPPPSAWAAPQAVVVRDGRLRLDNGLCRERMEVVYFAGFGPKAQADCKVNEVEVPVVKGQPLGQARERLEAQPLTPVLVWKPAAPAQPVNVVLDQIPAGGRLSSFDEVKLVLAKPLHGIVPKVEGVPLRTALERLGRLGLKAEVAAFAEGPSGTVVGQQPRGGVAAAPGMTVKLVVARG